MASETPSVVVVDASVVLKWQFDDEELVPQAIALRDVYYTRQAITLIAPQLLVYEVINGIATAARRKRIATDRAVEALGNLLAVGIETRQTTSRRVLEVALKHNLAAYDAAYLALAEDEKCDLWTADRPFYEAVKRESPHVRWIGDYAG